MPAESAALLLVLSMHAAKSAKAPAAMSGHVYNTSKVSQWQAQQYRVMGQLPSDVSIRLLAAVMANPQIERCGQA